MLIINRGIIILIIVFFVFYVAEAQNPQATPVYDVEVLARQVIAAISNEERQKLIEAHQDLLTPQFFQAIIALSYEEDNELRIIDTFRFVKQLAHNRNDAESAISISFELGIRLLKTKQQEEATKVFEDIRSFLPSIGALNVGKAFVIAGNIYQEARLFKESLSWHLEAKTLLEKAQNQEGNTERQRVEIIGYLAESWRGQGVAYGETERYDEALKALKKSEELFNVPPQNKLGLSSVKNDYGTVYDNLGNDRLAAKSYFDAIKLLESIDPNRLSNPEKFKEGIAIIKINLGLLQTTSLGEYEKALKNFEESELILADKPEFKSHLVLMYGNRVIALNRLGRFEQGIENAQKLLNFSEDFNANDKAIAYNLFIDAQLGLKRYDEALKNVNKLVLLTGVNRDIEQWSLSTKGRVLSKLRRFPEAARAFKEAISIVEDLTDEAIGDEKARADFFSRMIYPYLYMADLLLQQGDYEKALIYAENSKAKEILSSLQGLRNDQNHGMTSIQKQQELELIKKLTLINIELNKKEEYSDTPTSVKEDLLKQREELRQQLEIFRLGLYKSDSALRARRVDIALQELTKLNIVLPDNKTIGLHYVITPEKVWLLIITKNSNGKIKVIGQPLKASENELKQLVNNFRSSLENARGGFDKDSQELYSALLKPAEAELIGKEAVIIVPDGILWDLPFQALLDEQGKYFIENHAVFYTPSFFALAEIEEAKRSRTANYKRPLLALGNPDIGIGSKTNEIAEIMGAKLKPLPQTEDEVNNLCQLFSSCKDSTYVRSDATETRVKLEAKGTRFIHLAAHGVLDNSNPLYSFVVLSQTGNNAQEDGLLETWELMNLDLSSTEMLVLSACETGRGELRQGEGIIGLVWAAFIAGSPTTVASQWKVDANSTSLLMSNFYNNLFPNSSRNSGINRPATISKAKAMQKSMKKLIKPTKTDKINNDFKHPYFWAGFIVVGDGQ